MITFAVVVILVTLALLAMIAAVLYQLFALQHDSVSLLEQWHEEWLSSFEPDELCEEESGPESKS